jgi:hypothetical protein
MSSVSENAPTESKAVEAKKIADEKETLGERDI